MLDEGFSIIFGSYKWEKTYLFYFLKENFVVDNKMLGMNMKVERVGLERIKAKMSTLQNNSQPKINNFLDFERKFQEELRKREEQKAKKKLKKGEINQNIEKKLIENGLIESNENGKDNFGLPIAFSSKKIKK